MSSKREKLMMNFEEEYSDELIENDGQVVEENSKDIKEYSQMEHATLEPRRSQYLAGHIATTQTQAYDPDQDQREVLQIRKSYAYLRGELNKNSRELVKADSDKLSKLLDQANDVFSHVRTTFDASLDSRFITNAADLGVEKVHKLPLFVSEFSLDTYLRIVNQYLVSNSWEDLGNLASLYWTGVETVDFMLGPMEIEVKKRTILQNQPSKTQKFNNTPAIKPTVVDLASRENNSAELSKETSENVMKVYGILEGIGSFPFYHFVTDPDSFARTVENIFYVSFLIRDNRARIFIPELAASTNELYIEAIIPDDEEERPSDTTGDINQMVLGMTTKIWRKCIEKYKIEKPFLMLS